MPLATNKCAAIPYKTCKYHVNSLSPSVAVVGGPFVRSFRVVFFLSLIMRYECKYVRSTCSEEMTITLSIVCDFIYIVRPGFEVKMFASMKAAQTCV